MKKTLFTFFTLISLFILMGCNQKEVTITFVENGGEEIKDLVVYQETKIDSPSITREGYTFGGWFEDAALTIPFNEENMIVRNMVLYAKWTINSYTIVFNFNNGDDPYSLTENFSANLDYPQTPLKTGYEFGGWFTDEAFTTSFNDISIPARDVTLYAHWIPNQYTVNFYIDDDNEPIYTEVVNYGEDVQNIPSIPVVTGMDGIWNADLTNVTSDINVYAVYDKQEFTVTFKDYEGNVYNTLTVEYGDKITPTSTPLRTGYDFIGYYNPELERNIDLSTFIVTDNLVLVDNFKIKTFSVKFYGGDNGTLIGSVQYINYGDSATAPTTGFDRVGYTFTSWSVDFDSITQDINVYAEYSINSYLVTFNANGGRFNNDEAIYQISSEYNSNITSPEIPTKAGFVFIGWYLELTYENEVYFGLGIATPLNGLTVYAKWVELVATTYTVSGNYFFEEQAISEDQKTLLDTYSVTNSESYTPFINILYNTEMSPIRDIEGYEFYKYVYQGQEYFDASLLVNITQNEVIDVYYRRVVLTVDFDEFVNNQSVNTRYFVYYNGTINNVPTPTEVSGMFVEWERQNFENIKTNLKVAAVQYDTSLQTIIFSSNGSIIYIAINQPNIYNVIDPHAVVIAADSALWNIQQNGYRFLGWFIEGTDTQVDVNTIYFDDSYFSENNITNIEARWVKLEALHEADNINVEVNLNDETIIIDFTVNPVDVNGLDIYPNDFTFILNGSFISSDLVSNDKLSNYLTKDGNKYTLTISKDDPYYIFFKEKLMVDSSILELIPGTHSLQIISVGDNYNVLSSNPSDVYQYVVKSIYEGIPESQIVKDYYIIENYGHDTLRYIFYTNLTYQFSGMSFKIESGSNHISANGSILKTSSIPGDFKFTISDENGSRTYEGLVVEDIRQFNIGINYQNYLTNVNGNNEDDLFLKNCADYPYYVGVGNEFHLDILIRDNNGSKIDLDTALLTYKFYLNDSLVALDENTLASYLILNENTMQFKTSAIGKNFRIVVEPKYESLLMDMNPIEYNITINDGHNAFSNEQLKELFGDLNVHLINIHSDIEAKLSSNQLYEDGSPINFLATAQNDYNNYGNVYYRIDGNTDNDNIRIEGNFMTIDGSNLEYINPNMAGSGTISYSQAFEVVSVQIGIFYYNVYQTTPVNNNQFTMSNLRILGNTTTPSINYGGTEEEIYNQERLMSRNSGGMLGVVIRNGKAYLDNLIIGYTNIGVTTNAYGEDSNQNPLTVDIDYVSIYDSWANSIYLWHGSGIEIYNSSIASSGGASIHFDDTNPGTTGYDDPLLKIGENVEFNNWISGQEAWFKAYAMSSVALALKSNINNAISPLSKTIIQMKENAVTGLETEMINLVFLSLPNSRAVSYSNPNDSSSVISASEVSLDITDATGNTILDRDWNFTDKLWQLDATTSIIDPRVMDGQFGFALGSLSDTYAFLGMIGQIKTIYYQTYGAMMSDQDAGNLATIAGFYNLTAAEALQVGGYLAYSYTIHQAVEAVKGSMDYAQPRFIEVVAPIALTGAAGNATVLIEMFNTEDNQ